MRVRIHAGALSADNGAYAPLSLYFELAKMLGVDAQPGGYYGDDHLEFADEDWPSLEAVLIEAKMLYMLPGTHETWQNVQTEAVRCRLRGVLPA